MDRRGFLKLLAAGTTGLVLDPEKLLWVPGKKKIFLPAITPVSLYGIPYHFSNACAGQWIGFQRDHEALTNDIKNLIKFIEQEKQNAPMVEWQTQRT